MSEQKKAWEERKEALFLDKKTGYDTVDAKTLDAMNQYCEGYKKFLDDAKTEREAVVAATAIAEANGFIPFTRGMALKAGDKVYLNNRNKSMMLAVIGEASLAEGVMIGASHIDSPRLDLKPYPVFEDSDIAMLKTHYYGGIRKYQWLSIPLELHGTVIRKDGTSVNINIGGKPGDPVVVIPDLLPHLAGEQSSKTVSAAFEGEKMNIFVGSRPYPEAEGAGRFKMYVLDLLNKEYGITEGDFLTAEISAVPAYTAMDVGLDRSMIGAYGQDDRVCSYASLMGIIGAEKHHKTAVCVLADKEEIGSMGVSGMQSAAFDTFMSDLCDTQGVAVRECLEHSFCLSSDVTACFDPNYPNVYDARNSSFINQGISLCKYTGSRGKGGCNDASAEVMGYARKIFQENDVLWSVAELGAIDVGGGGTVALYMSNRNIDTVDAGTPVFGMHSPFEVTSKLDCYMTFKAMKAIYEQ